LADSRVQVLVYCCSRMGNGSCSEEETEQPKEDDKPEIYKALKEDLRLFEDIFKKKAKELGFPGDFLIDELPLDMAEMLHKAINEEVDKMNKEGEY